MLTFNSIKLCLLSHARYNNHVSGIVGLAGLKTKGNNESSNSSDSEKTEDSLVHDKSTKTMNIHVTNTRVDLIVKSGLGIARNKIEKMFYENKIRLNGRKIGKKSEQVEEGDEIDVIKGPSPNNPDFLVVARVEVLSMKPDEDSISVKIRRCKSLLVDGKSY